MADTCFVVLLHTGHSKNLKHLYFDTNSMDVCASVAKMARAVNLFRNIRRNPSLSPTLSTLHLLLFLRIFRVIFILLCQQPCDSQ